MTEDVAIWNALLGMTGSEREHLILLAHAGPQGLGHGDGIEEVLSRLRTVRHLASYQQAPADRPKGWRYFLLPEAKPIAQAALARAQRGDEEARIIGRLIQRGILPAPKPAPAPTPAPPVSQVMSRGSSAAHARAPKAAGMRAAR
jgi:hypothetical protein